MEFRQRSLIIFYCTCESVSILFSCPFYLLPDCTASDSFLLVFYVYSVQKNALVLPREIVLSEMDLYTSSTYGSIGFSVAMKMKTFKTVDEQPPIMEIQLIMQRPTQLKSL